MSCMEIVVLPCKTRLVCGIANPAVQKRLLSEPELTLTKAVTITQTLELAEKVSRTFSHQLSKTSLKTFTSFHTHQIPRIPHKHVKMLLSVTVLVIAVVANIISQHVVSSLKCATSVRNESISKRYVCRSKLAQNKAPVAVESSKPTHQVTQDSCDTVSPEYTLFTLPSQQTKPHQADVEIEGHHLNMEIDTGAAVSIISDARTSLSHLQILPLQPTQVKLRIYTGESIPVLGELSVNVTYGGTSCTLPLLVVKEAGPSLIGRNWLTKIQLDWKSIFTISGEQQFDGLL